MAGDGGGWAGVAGEGAECEGWRCGMAGDGGGWGNEVGAQ